MGIWGYLIVRQTQITNQITVVGISWDATRKSGVMPVIIIHHPKTYFTTIYHRHRHHNNNHHHDHDHDRPSWSSIIIITTIITIWILFIWINTSDLSDLLSLQLPRTIYTQAITILHTLQTYYKLSILIRRCGRSPHQLARTQMVRTELAKPRPRAGEADITRQVAPPDFQEAPLNAGTLTLATGVPPVSQTVYG